MDTKSNEITAIPLLLELLELQGRTVIISAMGCQIEIAAKIVARDGEYVLALKGNHEKLHTAVMQAFETKASRSGAAWKKLTTLVLVLRTVQVGDHETSEAHYYLSSLPPQVKTLADAIRRHWLIKSRLHWVLDVTFTEDASRIRKQHAPQTSAMLRRLAVSILSVDISVKDNLRGITLPSLPLHRSPGRHPPQFQRKFKMRLPCEIPEDQSKEILKEFELVKVQKILIEYPRLSNEVRKRQVKEDMPARRL